MSPLGGFGPFSFRTLSYMPAFRADTAESKEKRETLIVANAWAALLSKTLTQPATTWTERVKQIDAALDAVEGMVSR